MLLKIYDNNPNPKDISIVVDTLRQGGVIVYPTDTLYALGCDITNAEAVERICRIKNIDVDKALLTIVCGSISQISQFTTINDTTFRMLKSCLPGPFTFIFKGNKELPKPLRKRKHVGIRIPDNAIAYAIVEALGHPILSSSVPVNEDDEAYYTNPELIEECYTNLIDCVIDGGMGGTEGSTVIDCTGDEPVEKRKGKGILI